MKRGTPGTTFVVVPRVLARKETSVSWFLQETDFVRYGLSHWVVLALFGALTVILVRYGQIHRATPRPRRLPRLLAVILLAVQLPLTTYSMLPAQWGLADSLPFHLCDLAWMVAVYALWSGRFWAFALVFYWGLTLTSQALLTPQVRFDFPHLQFFMFWSSHCLVVLSAIYLTLGLGLRPNWQSYRIVSVVTVSWLVLMLIFNSLAGTNYLLRELQTVGRVDPRPFRRLALVRVRRDSRLSHHVGCHDLALLQTACNGEVK